MTRTGNKFFSNKIMNNNNNNNNSYIVFKTSLVQQLKNNCLQVTNIFFKLEKIDASVLNNLSTHKFPFMLSSLTDGESNTDENL